MRGLPGHYVQYAKCSILALGCAASMLAVVQPAAAQDATLEEAIEAFQMADFDRSADLFSEVAEHAGADTTARKKALQYLGRIYAAKRMDEKARQAISALLELEPPLVEPDPDVEPVAFMKLYYEARKEACSCYAVEHDPGLQTMAVIDFTDSSIGEGDRYEPARWGIASMLINYLSGTTDLKVVERERLNWLLDEIKLNQSDLVDPSARVRSGHLLGATTMLTGGFMVRGKRVSVWARLDKVETGEVLLAEKVEGRTKNLPDLLEDLSLKVAQAINVTLDEKRLGVRKETNSLDAMLSYAEGLELERNGDYRSANEKFREALEYDPNYTRAKLKVDATQLTLAAAG